MYILADTLSLPTTLRIAISQQGAAQNQHYHNHPTLRGPFVVCGES